MLSFLHCFISMTVQFLLFRMALEYIRRIRHSQIVNSFHCLFLHVVAELGGGKKHLAVLLVRMFVSKVLSGQVPLKKEGISNFANCYGCVLEDKRKILA